MLTDALPHYSVRASKKARYLQLRIRVTGLEVVVPVKMRVTERDIHRFLIEKKAWIEKHSSRLLVSDIAQTVEALPQMLFFMSINETWQVRYQTVERSRMRLTLLETQQIVLEGAVCERERCVRLLKRWLKQKAESVLKSRLLQLAERVGFSFTLCAVRDMSSRWGSCSSQKKITLATNLIFLPAPLIDHVLLHELCHLKYMSHGKRFWQLLERFDPNARTHNRQLRNAAEWIPRWLLEV